MASIIVADEQEGRRNLLAGTLEREDYSVTRAGTLRQCEATALATMPDVVLMDGGWKTGDAIDAANRLSSDPEFALKCRIVILSSNVSQDYLVSAAKAGVSEVLSKPVDMKKLLVQLDKHSKKLFVEPPAKVKTGSGGGFFEVSVTPGDPSWSLPILKELLGDGAIDSLFVEDLVSKMDEEIDIGSDVLERLLRLAFDELILGAEVSVDLDEDLSEDEKKIAIENAKKERRSRLIDAMESQAEVIEEQLDEQLDRLMEPPKEVAILTKFTGMVPIDPNTLRMTKLSLEIIRDLFWDMGVPVRENLAMYSTQLEDAQQMVVDCLDALPEPPDEEE
ncbi:MAG: response regulator [Candidatus Thermoplasmatota archaeon]|jgi:CheY-like chemotaxis protein|nr:response regulator [Candidatus Thermoplasmatota archaeon]|tara:strand:- start:566 stop:1567 length:1002 start_codon:yes stop_codon:yes gene_type:complete